MKKCVYSAEQRSKKLLLLMSVLSQTLLTLVGRHFVLLSFLSAWHNALDFVPCSGKGFVQQLF
jgi:hypothetical protein